MTIQELHQKIDSTLNHIQYLNSDFDQRNTEISQLELDLMRKYCIELYDLVNKMGLAAKVKNAQLKMNQTQQKKEVTNEEVEVQQQAFIEKKENDPEPILKDLEEDYSKEEEIMLEIEVEKVVMNETPVVETPVEKLSNPIEPQVKLSTPASQEFVKKILQSAPSNQSLFEKYKSSPISSVTKAISVLKRFEYQSALFKSDIEAYNEFIANLEHAGSLDKAVEVFHQGKRNYQWEEETLELEIMTLIYRRYMD
jgi:hypothetical protein